MISTRAAAKLGLSRITMFPFRKTHWKGPRISALPLPQDPAELVEYYNSLSSSYDQLYGEEQLKKHQLVQSLLGNRTWDLMADVGCGTGSLLAKMAGNCGQLVGTDVSKGMLKTAKQKLGRNTADLVRAHSSSLPLRDHVCDGVLSISMLTRESAQRQVSELLRIARPGGTVAFTILNPEDGGGSRSVLSKDLVGENIPVSQREMLHLIRLQEPEQGPASRERVG